jgi:transcriptional regulator with XRE-family HTH domain
VRPYLRHTRARWLVLELLSAAPEGLVLGELHERLASHRHAADRAVQALTAEGRVMMSEVVTPDRRGRPRVTLALVPARACAPVSPAQAHETPSRLPRFSGEDLRQARLRAGMTMAVLARQLGVSESAVAWWERAPVVPPARSGEILRALSQLHAQDRPQRLVSNRIATRLRSFRAALGWSQTRLALSLGVSQSTIANWEAGRGLTLENARLVYDTLRQAEPPLRLEACQLRQLRARQGWSQTELARRAEVGVATIKRWETGRTSIPPHRTELLRVLLAT